VRILNEFAGTGTVPEELDDKIATII